MDNIELHGDLINDMSDLLGQFESSKIDYLTFVKTLENIVNYENGKIRIINSISDKLSKKDQKKFRRDLNEKK